MRETPQEIERRFLVANPPARIKLGKGHKIRQGYVSVNGLRQVRIRQMQNRFSMTVKVGEGMVRQEVEITISKVQFDALWPLTAGRRVEKLRFRLPYRKRMIELDHFEGDLTGLKIAEVEFPDAQQSKRFRPPAWFGDEVTEIHEYSNVSLAVQGMPVRRGYDYCIGALPYIRKADGIHIVVITNRSGNRWIVPKGQPEDDMPRRNVAEMEAVEEAGVLGTITHGIHGQCRLKNDLRMYLYPLKVSTVLKKWSESSFRKRKVLPVKEAIDLISDKGLCACIKRLIARLD